MNKKTKMYVGVAVVAAAAYYFWSKSQKDKTAAKFVGAAGKKRAGTPCQFIENGELYSGRISSYGNNVCQSSASNSLKGEPL
jgi:hypothetical protein